MRTLSTRIWDKYASKVRIFRFFTEPAFGAHALGGYQQRHLANRGVRLPWSRDDVASVNVWHNVKKTNTGQ